MGCESAFRARKHFKSEKVHPFQFFGDPPKRKKWLKEIRIASIKRDSVLVCIKIIFLEMKKCVAAAQAIAALKMPLVYVIALIYHCLLRLLDKLISLAWKVFKKQKN